MKLVPAKELLFYEGFRTYIADLLQALHYPIDAAVRLRRTDSEQLPVLNDYCDIVLRLELSYHDVANDAWYNAEVDVTSSDDAELYAIGLRLYREKLLWKGVVYAPSEKNNAKDVGAVIATAVYLFWSEGHSLPESLEFLQDAVDRCEE